MARFPDVYIRPAETPVPDFIVEINALDAWDRPEYVQKAVKWVIDKDVSTPIADGTVMVESEKITIDFGIIRTDKANYDYLRTQFHNVLCDILFYDSKVDSFLSAFWGIRMHVEPVAEGSVSAIFKISGERSFTGLSLVNIATFDANTPTGIITGTVFNTDGVTPLDAVTLSVLDVNEAYEICDVTDSEGHYLIEAACNPTLVYNFTLTKNGKTFPADQTVTAIRNQEVTKNFTALT